MKKPDFSDAAVKLERANKHIADVDQAIQKFLESKFYRWRLEADPSVGRMKLIFESVHEPDKQINVLLGDAIGNLRSSLDYLFSAMMFAFTGKRDAGGFPFADDDSGFVGEVKKGAIGTVVPMVVDIFLNEVQAHKGGAGEHLWMLNKLRNIDKHRLLITTSELAGVRASIRYQWMTINDCSFMVSPGQSSTLLDVPIGHVEFASDPKPLYEIKINEPPNCAGLEVVTLLRSCSVKIESILKSLQGAF